ncbi:hypothetical protein X279_05070 [Oenococcus oeni IOEB_0501]|nr:CotH kinase family protein [Oenococcus oeni]KEP87902.1 hypothetical protein X279_05070 [Oenococcus oeni IOEB_0501]
MVYNKTTWATGDVISADKLNNAESGIETASLASDLPRVDLTGDTTAMTGDVAVPLQFRFRDGQQDVSAYVSTKWQGDTSQSYPKKNLSFKFYSDSALSNKLSWKPRSSWKKDNSFNLKANWIDRTEARNLVNAQIQAEVFASQPVYFGNANAIPTRYSQIETNKSTQQIILYSFLPNVYLSQSLHLSADVQLVEDLGAANNKARLFLYRSDGVDVSSNTIDLSTAPVGGTVHYESDVPNTDGKWFKYLYACGGDGYEVNTSHVIFKNISLTATTGTTVYAPSILDNRDSFYQSANYAAIQGFPVEMYLNGVDQGLYTFNTRKDNNLTNMDKSNPNHILVEVGNIDFSKPSYVLDGTDGDPVTPDLTPDVVAKFNRLAAFVNTSSDTDFVANIAQYVDLYSVIDTIILKVVMNNIDGGTKSVLYATYDGNTWLTIPYDLDSTWQLWWDGASNTQPWIAANVSSSVLQSRVLNLFHDQVIDRYNKLRQRALSAGHIVSLFKTYIDQIPRTVYDNNETLWPAIPSIKITDFVQIQQSISTLLKNADYIFQSGVTSGDSNVDTSGQPQ